MARQLPGAIFMAKNRWSSSKAINAGHAFPDCDQIAWLHDSEVHLALYRKSAWV